jgi:hypothetical protein
MLACILRMKLYEVIFCGSRGNGDDEETIYLVRAPDFRTALEDVQRNASPMRPCTARRILTI